PIAVGVFVSCPGVSGFSLMGSQPILVSALLFLTVIRAALFSGVPVGPLIAAAIIPLFIGKPSPGYRDSRPISPRALF
ncbi:DUF441 family protein, partial [Klebsiella pneumoniae]|nr:DUF441 family protein [Klebsiella pneumoniae]